MARGRELSQLGSLITVDDSTKNIGVATATPSQKIGIGTLSPTSKVEVVGDVFISGIITATTLSGDGSGLSNVPGSAFSNLSEDTTPQLGGNLDVNGKDITGTGNLNISGVITATSFSGNGSALIGVASTDNIQTATEAVFLSGVKITGVTTATGGVVGNLTGNVTGNTSGSSGSCTGNAATATILQTSRTIAGVSFDGSANISLNNNAITNGAGYITTSHGFTNTNQLTNGAGFITSSDDISGNAATATILQTSRTIAGVSFDGSSNISLNNNAITNGAGYITSSGTASLSEGLTGTPNVTVGVVTASDLTLSGNLTVNGTTTTLNTATLTVEDKNITLASGAASSSDADGSGLTVSGANATFNYSHSGTKWVANKSIEATSFIGNVTGNISGSSGSCTGNSATATALATARTIAGVSFDGSSNISLNNNAITNGAGYITTSHAFTNTNQLTNGAGYITSSGTAALAQGLTGTPSISVTNINASGDVSAANFNSTSDITLKQDVSVIDNALEMISQLEGVSWKWKESLEPSLGVTAQNVEEVAPELVSNGDHKSVNYNGLIGILIEAVKELKYEVDKLKR